MQEKNERELQQLKNRFRDLANKSYQQNIYTFTDFLGLMEQDVFWKMEGELKRSGYTIWGGRPAAERVMIRFGNAEEFGYDADFPFVCIHIHPLNQKFADDLTHRDFLGALMNLGIQRSTLGDIVAGEKQAFLFCQEKMADFVCKNLTQVRHTQVSCGVTENFQSLAREEPEKRFVQVASPRADSVIAKVYNLSREESLQLFRTGKIFIDGRLCENNSRILRAGETVNARGFGKFSFLEEKGETRKGKTNVEVAVFR